MREKDQEEDGKHSSTTLLIALRARCRKWRVLSLNLSFHDMLEENACLLVM